MSAPPETPAPDAALVVLATCPPEAAPGLAEALVQARCCACVNILPGVESVYRWQGAVERSGEALLLIKTRQSCYAALEQQLRARHPYELPEILAVKVQSGLPGYLQWIFDSTC